MLEKLHPLTLCVDHDAVCNLVDLNNHQYQLDVGIHTLSIAAENNTGLNAQLGLEVLDDVGRMVKSIYDTVIRALNKMWSMIETAIRHLFKLIGVNIRDRRKYADKPTPDTDKKAVEKAIAASPQPRRLQELVDNYIRQATDAVIKGKPPTDIAPIQLTDEANKALDNDTRLRMRNYIVAQIIDGAKTVSLSYLKGRSDLEFNPGVTYLNDTLTAIDSERLRYVVDYLNHVKRLGDSLDAVYQELSDRLLEAIVKAGTENTQVILTTKDTVEAFLVALEQALDIDKINRGFLRSVKSTSVPLGQTGLVLVWTGAGLPYLTKNDVKHIALEYTPAMSEQDWDGITEVSKAIEKWDKQNKALNAVFGSNTLVGKDDVMEKGKILTDDARYKLASLHANLLNAEAKTRAALFGYTRNIIIASLHVNNLYHNLFNADAWRLDIGL